MSEWKPPPPGVSLWSEVSGHDHTGGHEVSGPDTHTEVVIEGAGLEHLLVQLGIERLPKENVVSDGGELDPGLLGGQAEAFGQVPQCHAPTQPAESQASGMGAGSRLSLSMPGPCLR